MTLTSASFPPSEGVSDGGTYRLLTYRNQQLGFSNDIRAPSEATSAAAKTTVLLLMVAQSNTLGTPAIRKSQTFLGRTTRVGTDVAMI